MEGFAPGLVPTRFTKDAGRVLVLKAATPSLADKKAIQRAILGWQRCARNNPDPAARDAAELAVLAYKKWTYYLKGLEVASSLKVLRAKARDNPHAEVAVLLIAEAPWLPRGRSPIVGLCLFRRSWCNNVLIDFLASDPRLQGLGVATGLLVQLVRITEALGADVLWGETTQNSVGYYGRLFGKPDMQDLLHLSKAERNSFLERMARAEAEVAGG